MAVLDSTAGVFPISWKRYILPSIHPQGWKIVFAVFLLFLAAALLCAFFIPAPWGAHACAAAAIVGIPLTLFSFYFFRNPDRVTPDDPDGIFSPADGLVCSIVKMVPPKTLDLGEEERIRVSVFMSVFSVHVNRAPCAGMVRALTYHHGKFVSAADKDSDENERQEICLQRPDSVRIGVVQIAGLVARRIYTPLTLGQRLAAGEVFGLIRFGSRLDVYLPPGIQPSVLLGQTTIAGETLIARVPQGKADSAGTADSGAVEGDFSHAR
ncbi:MAG: phosphatidylserine decarboxylase family protein [Thermoguttaceae bacterium]|nr:phosphatidylserine decarboxylase family protein [Thermoguttaceae bacterium]